MDRGGDYQQQQHQGVGNYNQYDDNSSVGVISGRKIYVTNTLPPLPRGPSLAPHVNANSSVQSDYVDRYQFSTHSTSYQQARNEFGHR